MLMETLKDSVSVQRLLENYRGYGTNEQGIIALLVAAIFAAILVFGLIVPASTYNDTAQSDYRSQLDTHQLMQQNKGVFATTNGSPARDSEQSLLGLANASSKAFGFVFKRYEPVGENGLSLWLEDVPFNNIILWLQRLHSQYNIKVTEIVVDQQSRAGMVNVRLELQG